jgi:hypothetical protein
LVNLAIKYASVHGLSTDLFTVYRKKYHKSAQIHIVCLRDLRDFGARSIACGKYGLGRYLLDG